MLCLAACGTPAEETTAPNEATPPPETVPATTEPVMIADPTVTVTGGEIQGMRNEDATVHIFKGIPYAAAPVGDLRWKAPQPVENWDGVKVCTEYSASAMQAEQAPWGVYTDEFIIDTSLGYSEDCLYLNVWTPVDADGDEPVLVFIHGGNNVSGSASCEIYDGEEMAKKGIVFVSINYRVGIFGFLASSELSAESPDNISGNYALQDQIFALKWIQDNISEFGGDATNVTISGQSAGSYDVNMLSVCPEAEGLFNNIFTMSFNLVESNPKYVPMAQADKEAEGDAFFAGRSLEEMRALSAEEVLSTGAVSNYGNIDGKFVLGSYRDMILAGNALDVNIISGNVTGGYDFYGDPMLLGAFLTGGDMFDLFMGMGSMPPATVEDYQTMVSERVGDKAEEFLSLYPVETVDELASVLVEIENDALIAKQQMNAELWNAHKNNQVYVYLFDHVMAGNDASGNLMTVAFHSGDIPYWFNHLTDLRADVWTESDVVLADVMSDYVANFVKSGNPNGSNLPVWSAYTADTETYSYLYLGDSASEMEMDSAKTAFWRYLLGTLYEIS